MEFPIVILLPASTPVKTLYLPDVKEYPALSPIAILDVPTVFGAHVLVVSIQYFVY